MPTIEQQRAEEKKIVRAFFFLDLSVRFEKGFLTGKCGKGVDVWVDYNESSRFFSVRSDRGKSAASVIHIFETDGRNEVLAAGIVHPLTIEHLLRGLYHLGLLAPEVERALQATVSQHQKMVWTLEYSDRYPDEDSH